MGGCAQRTYTSDAATCPTCTTATPGTTDLYGATAYIRNTPACPSGGTYTIGDMNTRPVCGIGTNGTAVTSDDHTLP